MQWITMDYEKLSIVIHTVAAPFGFKEQIPAFGGAYETDAGSVVHLEFILDHQL